MYGCYGIQLSLFRLVGTPHAIISSVSFANCRLGRAQSLKGTQDSLHRASETPEFHVPSATYLDNSDRCGETACVVVSVISLNELDNEGGYVGLVFCWVGEVVNWCK